MSETLTKLGGYVVNGQPELTTDNTLSGTGLPDSPLGVTTSAMPGNETVLFNGNGDTYSSCTLSEPYTNFERIGILLAGSGCAQTPQYSYLDTDYIKTTSPLIYCQGEKNAYITEVKLSQLDTTGFLISASRSRYNGWLTTAVDTIRVNDSSDMTCITKVVGINRKES